MVVPLPGTTTRDPTVAKCAAMNTTRLSELIAAGARHTFDRFECAIQAIAPILEHCRCRVISYGVEVAGASSAVLTAQDLQPPQMSEIVRHRSYEGGRV